MFKRANKDNDLTLGEYWKKNNKKLQRKGWKIIKKLQKERIVDSVLMLSTIVASFKGLCDETTFNAVWDYCMSFYNINELIINPPNNKLTEGYIG